MVTSFARMLKECRVKVGIQQAELGERVGVTGSYISLLESGKRPPPTDEVTREMEKVLGVRPGELVNLAHLERTPADIRAQMDLDRLYREGTLHVRAGVNEETLTVMGVQRKVPLINKVAAGYPSDFTDKGYPVGVAEEYITVPDLDDPNAFAITVIGDSMEPRFREGDVLVISPQVPVSSGDFCFVRIDDNGESRCAIKQVWFDEDRTVRLVSLNTKYPSQVVDKDRVGGLYRAIHRLEKL